MMKVKQEERKRGRAEERKKQKRRNEEEKGKRRKEKRKTISGNQCNLWTKIFVVIRVIRGPVFVWDFENLNFEFVLNFEFRASDLFPWRGNR